MQLLSSKETRSLLKVSNRKLFQMIKAGELKTIRLGRVLRFDTRDIDALLAKAKR